MLRCGAYLRLSKEDNRLEESNSIQAQRSLIQRHVEQMSNMEYLYEWVDDGYSGSTFSRPGFEAMLQTLAKGQVDCILVKDLSRLGREYIQTGYLLQQVFPRYGVRLISIGDSYDSDKSDFMEQALLLPVLNLLNDAYCRDISMKVRLSQRNKREQGLYVGAFSAYGYVKDPVDYHKLLKDTEAAQVVRIIYVLRLLGLSAEKISLLLNDQGILSPLSYKKANGSAYVSGFAKPPGSHWTPQSIRRILENKMYAGSLEQGKRKKISYKLPVRQWVPKSEWSVIPDGVDAIVEPWLYEKVQLLATGHSHCKTGEWFCSVWSGLWNKRNVTRPIPLAVVERALERCLTIDPNMTPMQKRLWIRLLVKEVEWNERGELWIALSYQKNNHLADCVVCQTIGTASKSQG